ncbi:hypothetical protein FBQ97_18645 [Acidobacteria bacterium ACD]|nr:hypothetical protein [Acidobacteria bacterium ACD]
MCFDCVPVCPSGAIRNAERKSGGTFSNPLPWS